MDLSKTQLFSALSQRMAWLRDRQEILAQNVANANTPGYVARDIEPLSFRDLVRGRTQTSLAPRLTDAKHQFGGQSPPSRTNGVIVDASAEPSLTGNAVSLEGQLMKVSETNMDYQIMTNLYRKHIDMLKTALGRGN